MLDATTIDDPFAPFNGPDSPILFPVAERAVAWQGRDDVWHQAPHHKAIVRVHPSGRGATALNIVGAGYKLVQNRELFHNVEETMRQQMLPEHLVGVQVKDRVAYYGRVCYRDYVFPNIRCRVQPKTSYTRVASDVAFRIIVQNGYGGSALRIHSGAIDFYCSNGMIRGEYSTSYRKHTKGLVVDNLGSVVTKALLSFSAAQDVWQQWAGTTVSATSVTEFFNKIAMSEKMKDGLSDQYMRERDERGPNLWALYSALTYYASHDDGAFALRRKNDDLDSASATMMQREINVSKWTQLPEWQAMENA